MPFSLAISCAMMPAARASWAPLPGYSSTLWMKVPTGMFFTGQSVAGLDIGIGACDNRVADLQAVRERGCISSRRPHTASRAMRAERFGSYSMF